jgi:hypothetical protein
MPNTTNYSFPTPADTDLVKNGADAIRDLGDAVDTAMNTALGTKKAGMVLLNTTSFSAVASQNLQFFSSTYDNYKIIVKFSAFSGDGSIRYRMSASGVDATGSNYNTGLRYIYSVGSPGDTQDNNQTSGNLTPFRNANPQDTKIVLDVVSPFLAERTGVIFSGNANDGVQWMSIIGTSAHRVSTSYDGITFFPTTGTMTGIVSVYGYNK